MTFIQRCENRIKEVSKVVYKIMPYCQFYSEFDPKMAKYTICIKWIIRGTFKRYVVSIPMELLLEDKYVRCLYRDIKSAFDDSLIKSVLDDINKEV